MKNELLKYLENEINENKLSHAFLISTNDCNLALSNIFDLLKAKLLIPENDIENNLNVYIISDENNLIDKSKIIDLQKYIITKPLNLYKKIYFIKNAEFLNMSSSNKLLKILEEPSNDVIGFILTEDESKILTTIKSRCCRFNYNFNIPSNFKIDDNLYELFINIPSLSNVELYNLKKKLVQFNKIELLDLFCTIQERINHDIYIKDNTYYLANLYKILDNINDLINRNVNIELCLDKFFIEIKKEG